MAEDLYYKLRQEQNGEVVVEGYAYGEDWVAMAMYMDDLIFDTPEAAKEWWRKTMGNMGLPKIWNGGPLYDDDDDSFHWWFCESVGEWDLAELKKAVDDIFENSNELEEINE